MTGIGSEEWVAPAGAAASTPARARLTSLVRGRVDDPAWVRPALVGILALATALYVWRLDLSGWANAYYAAAAQAASQSWSAFFFGSFDAAGFITVDKPPAALWLMGLSVRLFGLSSWSILLPQALLGIATVGFVYLATRRSFGAPAGLVAALVMALTPVAAVIFRYDNPDALLTFLCVLAAWSLLRGIESGRTRWVLFAAALVGLAFDTKYLQGFVVLPAFALTFLVAGKPDLRRRVVELVAAAAVVLVSSAWWVAIVELVPAASRPYIGGSSANSVLDLVLGYDGLARVLGGGAGPGGVPGGGGGGGGFGGASGPLRMFNAEWGGQIGWLIPAAGIAAIGGIVARWRASRTDPARAGFLLWGGWLATHVVVFSLSAGNLHPYYSVILGPAIAALVGGGLAEWWRARRSRAIVADAVLASAILVTSAVAYALLARTPEFAPPLGSAILVVGLGSSVAVLFSSLLPNASRVALVGAGLGLVAGLLGPAAFVWDTIGTPLSGGDPSAGPVAATGGGPGRQDGLGGAPPGAFGGRGAPAGAAANAADDALIRYLEANRGTARWLVAAESANGAAGIQLASGDPVMAMGGFTGSDPAPTADDLAAYVASGELRYVYLGSGGRDGFAGGPGGFPGGAGGFPGGPGGFGAPGTVPPDGGDWGGAAGTDAGSAAPRDGVGGISGRASWVAANCSPVDYGGSGGSLYDCATPPASSGASTGG